MYKNATLIYHNKLLEKKFAFTTTETVNAELLLIYKHIPYAVLRFFKCFEDIEYISCNQTSTHVILLYLMVAVLVKFTSL